MILSLLLAIAQEAPVDCGKAETQVSINACAYQDFESADAALNRQWKITYETVKAEDEEQQKYREPNDTSRPGAVVLLEAQRAWLKYRDMQCEAEGHSYQGGSMQSMVVSNCKRDLTNAQIARLIAVIEV